MEKRRADPYKKKLDILLNDALKKRVFSACSVGYLKINQQGTDSNILHYGRAGKGKGVSPVDDQTVFDLASLTKPLVTSLCMLALIEEKQINIDERIDAFFKVRRPGYSKISLMHLLTHSSGLPAHRHFYTKLQCMADTKRMDILVDWILDEELLYEPGTENVYSDLGFMLLGRIIEKVSGSSLDEYWRRKIIFSQDLDSDLFFAAKQKNDSRIFADTGECSWSKLSLYGQVNDDNCRSLGGVAGHAGLFGTAKAVLALCEQIVLQYQGKLHHPSYRSQTLHTALAGKKGNWRFGFDTPSAALSSSGKYFSELSIGHLGFTGTSFWIDLQQAVAIVFLTNRVLYGDDLAPIKKLRPLVHDTLMESLTRNK